MARRYDFYFKQPVSEIELDDALDALEVADRQLIADQGFYGLFSGGALAAHSPVADLTVDMGGPVRGYDANGQRIYVPGPAANVNVALDSNGVSTAVQGASHEKWVSIFVRFKRELSDQRVDGNAQQIYYQREESYEILVVQGAEAAIGVAVRPSLISGALLVGDVHRVYAQTQVQAGNIDVSRRQDTVVMAAPSGGVGLRAGTVLGAVQAMLTALNNHILLPDNAHPASAIAAEASGTTPFGAFSTIAGTLQNVLGQIVEGVDAVSYTVASVATNLANLSTEVESPTYEDESVTTWKTGAKAELEAGAEMNFANSATLRLPVLGNTKFIDGTLTFARVAGALLFHSSEFVWTQVNGDGLWRLVESGGTGGVAAYRIQLPEQSFLQSISVLVKPATGHASMPEFKMRAQMITTLYHSDVSVAGAVVEVADVALGPYEGNTRTITIDDSSLPAGSGSAYPVTPGAKTYDVYIYGEFGTNAHTGGQIVNVVATYTMTGISYGAS